MELSQSFSLVANNHRPMFFWLGWQTVRSRIKPFSLVPSRKAFMRIPTSSDGAALAEFIRQVDFAA